jgi:hypothetical protein
MTKEEFVNLIRSTERTKLEAIGERELNSGKVAQLINKNIDKYDPAIKPFLEALIARYTHNRADLKE